MNSPAEYEQYRLALAKRLKALRRDAGISGPQLANLLTVSQSKISKIENGRTTPSIDDVIRFADALDASPEMREELVTHAHELVTKVRGWKGLFGGGARQRLRQMAEIEQASKTIRVFQPALVPGLLHTAEYSRRLFEAEPRFIEHERIPAGVAARMERQAILYDSDKALSFVVTEAALRSAYCGDRAMAAQMDRIISVITLSNVDVRVIPIGGRRNVVPLTPFTIYDKQLVAVETFTDGFQVFDPSDIGVYERVFDAACCEALKDEDAVDLVRDVRAAFLVGAAPPSS